MNGTEGRSTRVDGETTLDAQLLFVYGTLRRDSRHEMARYLERSAEFVGSALYCGKPYMIAHYPGVVASRNSKDLVHGDVFRLRAPTPSCASSMRTMAATRAIRTLVTCGACARSRRLGFTCTAAQHERCAASHPETTSSSRGQIVPSRSD